METQHKPRQGRLIRWPLAWSIAVPVLVMLAMLRGLKPSEPPEAIPPAPKLLPMRRTTSAIREIVPAPVPHEVQVTAARPSVLPSVPEELPERLKLNPQVDLEALTYDYPGIASDLLHFVKLAPNGGGGFVVQQVDPDSLYQQLGVRPGDVIYNIDPPPDSSLDVSFLRAEVKLEVFRDGQSVWLSYKPDQEPESAPQPAPSSPPQT